MEFEKVKSTENRYGYMDYKQILYKCYLCDFAKVVLEVVVVILYIYDSHLQLIPPCMALSPLAIYPIVSSFPLDKIWQDEIVYEWKKPLVNYVWWSFSGTLKRHLVQNTVWLLRM